MFRGNVRNKQRRANEEPPNVAPRQKVFFARPLAPRKVKSDPKHNQKVDADDRQIQIRKCLMRRGNLCRKKHSSLPWAPSPPWRAALTVFSCDFAAGSALRSLQHHLFPLNAGFVPSSPNFRKLFLAPLPFLRDTVGRCIGAKR